MNRIEFERLLELSRRSSKERPKPELVILGLIFFNGGRIGRNEIRSTIKLHYRTGWFSITESELNEAIPSLISKKLLTISDSNYVIPTNLLTVVKDLIEENLFPEPDEIEKILQKIDEKLKKKLVKIVSLLDAGKFYHYSEEEIDELREIEKYGLIIFGRSFFSSVDKISFGDNCIYMNPRIVFTIRSDLVRNEILKVTQIHKNEVFMLRKEKRDLMEKLLIQQDRINELYEQNQELREKMKNLEDSLKGFELGLSMKNLVNFRVAEIMRKYGKNKFIEKWNQCNTHGELVEMLLRIFHMMGYEVLKMEEEKAEPDLIASSFYSVPPYVLIVEVKTLQTRRRKLGVRQVSQVISKRKRYEKIFRKSKVFPVIFVACEPERISQAAVRECIENAVILTKNFTTKLVENHFNLKYTPSLLYSIFEPSDNPILSGEALNVINTIAEEENLSLKDEVIKLD